MDDIQKLISRLGNIVTDSPNRNAVISEAASTLEALNKVYEAAKKLQDDMKQRADIGTFDGDHSVQAGATVWWKFCTAIEELEGRDGQ